MNLLFEIQLLLQKIKDTFAQSNSIKECKSLALSTSTQLFELAVKGIDCLLSLAGELGISHPL